MKASLPLVLFIFEQAKFETVKEIERQNSIDFTFFIDRLNIHVDYSYTKEKGLESAILLVRTVEYQIGNNAGKLSLQEELKKLLNIKKSS